MDLIQVDDRIRGGLSRRIRANGRKRALSLVAASLAALSLGACAELATTPTSARVASVPSVRQQAPQRPNFLIIVADDLGFGDVGFNGAELPTPNIDRIASLGMRLDHFYVSPLCSPTRAGLLTGRYPHRFGIMGDTITPGSDFGLDPAEETIAQIVGRAGYERRSFLGKWHLGHRSRRHHPMSFGFTSFYGHYNGAIDYFTHEREGEPDWHRDYRPSNDQGYSTDLLTDEAVRIIVNPSPNGSPWLMWLAYNAPHGPLQATAEDLAAVGYDPALPPYGSGYGNRERDGYGLKGRGNTRRQTALAMIRGLDRGIGRVIDALAATGQLENTVILFTSDNGGAGNSNARETSQASNGPLRGWKFQHYEGGVRVAAALAWPAGLEPRPSADVGPISYVDIVPTFARLAGAPLAQPLDGEDVSRSLLRGEALPPRSLFLGEDYRVAPAYGERGPVDPISLKGRAAAAIEGGWKLIGDELYDLRNDPFEERDLAAERSDLVAQIRRKIEGYAGLRKISRDRMNAAQLPPVPSWDIEVTEAENTGR